MRNEVSANTEVLAVVVDVVEGGVSVDLIKKRPAKHVRSSLLSAYYD